MIRQRLERVDDVDGDPVVRTSHPALGVHHLVAAGSSALLFCENETNRQRVYGQPNTSRAVKDGINDGVVQGDTSGLAPDDSGTKVAARYSLDIAAGATEQVTLRLTAASESDAASGMGDDFWQRRT